MFKHFFLDRIVKLKNQDWYLQLEGYSKTLNYTYSVDIKDGICRLHLRYREEAYLVSPHFVILIEFYEWNSEESDYADYPSYVEIVKTTDMYDFEENAKVFIDLSRRIAKITGNERITFAELMKKLEEEGVKFGI